MHLKSQALFEVHIFYNFILILPRCCRSYTPTSAKTVRRTVFFRFAPSCSSPDLQSKKQRRAQRLSPAFLVPVAGLATLLPQLHAHVGENSPPDCFLPLRSLLFKSRKKQKQSQTKRFDSVSWSEWRDLNPRPLDPQSSALPTALHPDIICAPFRITCGNSDSV